jgi:RNA polymerase sigma factor (sigma-70 family)
VTKDHVSAAPRHVRTLFGIGRIADLTDGQLLERFAARPGEEAELAFAALVERHGPMVFRVCRRILDDPHDAHDAFQATFLVLVRQAATIRRRDSVACWLHGVAYRTASQSRAAAARRRRHERNAAEQVRRSFREEGSDEPALVLHEELERLAARYREVIVLCDLEGQTHEQAARRLRAPVGTIKSRLARGREQLRSRLVRRGLAPAVGGLGATFSEAAVPAVVAETTVRAAVRLAIGQPTAEMVPATVAALVEEWGRTRIMARSMMAGLTVVVFGFVATAAGVLAQPGAKEGQTTPPPGRAAVPEPAPGSMKAESMVEPPDILNVEAREALPGRPLSGERLVRPDGKISLGYYGEVYAAGLTPSEIKARVISQLRKHLSDEQLGLLRRDPDGTLHRVPPAESDRVSVSVSTSHSKVYYVLRGGRRPSRFPVTGNETVRDALAAAGLTARSLSSASVRLVRSSPSGGRSYSLPVDHDAILRDRDLATNHRLLPGDRIIVTRDSEVDPALRLVPTGPDGGRAADGRDQGRRLEEIERKLDRVLKVLEDPKRGGDL